MASATRFAASPSLAGPARGLSNVRDGAGRRGRRSAAGQLLVIEAASVPCRTILGAMSTPQAGDQAPEVALPDETGDHPPARRPIRLAGPSSTSTPRTTRPAAPPRRASSATCTTTSHGLDAEIWGVSPDGSGSHAAFRAKFGLPFTLLSDEDHAVADAYGAWQERNNYGRKYWGIVRSSFLVDPDGTVAHAWPKVKADGHAAEVLEALEAARAERAGLAG